MAYVEMRMSEQAIKKISINGFGRELAFKGITIQAQPFKEEELPELAQSQEPLCFVTAEQEDFQKISDMAYQFQKNANTLIIWLGDDIKPMISAIPVISWAQIKAKKMLNWEQMCAIAQTPEDGSIPTIKPNFN